MSRDGYLPPSCTQQMCDEAAPGYWDESDEIGECSMIKREHEKITAVICDFCLDEFRPEFENADDETEISVAWEQAEACGWVARWDADANSWLHCCPACARQVAA